MKAFVVPTACAVLALVAAIGIAADAGAQYGGPPGTPGNRGGLGGMGSPKGPPPEDGMRRGGMDVPLSPVAIVQAELDRIEDELKLTPAQLDAWRPYAERVQKLADYIARSRADARGVSASANAVQQLEQIASSAGIRATAVDEIVVAGRAFYSTLGDDQKRIADRRLWLPVSLLATGVMPPGMSDVAVRGGRRPPL
jgi:hypothetical protein